MNQPQRSRLFEWLQHHLLLTFFLLCLSFVTFGWLSFDLIRIFSANAEYLVDNGWQGLMDGGFEQLVDLVLTTLAAMVFYIVFKLCEAVLMQRLSNRRTERE